MELMAEFERIEHSDETVDMDAVKRLYDRLQLATQKMIVALNDIGDHRSGDLLKAHQQFNRETYPLFEPVLSRPTHPILVTLEDINPDMAACVGQKANQLGLVGKKLGLPVPEGFVLTAQAFDLFMEANDLPGVIDAYLRDLDIDDPGLVNERCEAVRRLILEAPVPQAIEGAAQAHLAQWRQDRGEPVFTAVRSTAIGEDGEMSFAGQFATLLNVPAKNVLAAYKEVLASKYSTGAVLYRMRCGLDDQSSPMAVMVMTMIPASASGVLYTRNPSRPDQSDLHVNAIHGLGEYLMGGDTAPHVLGICRRTGRIKTRHATQQSHWITTIPEGGTRLEPMSPADAAHTPVDDASARRLADWGERLESYFGSPQDVEWAIDGNQRLYLLQSRTLGLDGPSPCKPDDCSSFEGLHVLHSGGHKACSGIVSGRIYYADEALSETVPADSILVIPKAAPEYAPVVARVRGVIAAKGSTASHLASVAREFGVPMIVDAGPLNAKLRGKGRWVTLYADEMTVYDGRVPASEGRPAHPVSDPFESPVRRRLRALSNRITYRHPVPCENMHPIPDSERTLHDIIWQTHAFAMETLHAQGSEKEKGIRIVRWTGDNAASDFAMGTGSANAATVGEKCLQSFWSGLTGTGREAKANPSLEMEGYAFIGDESLYVMMPAGSQQITIDARRSPMTAITQLHLNALGGTGPYYQRCLLTRLLAEILEVLGFTLQIDGTRLKATISTADSDPGGDMLFETGRLLAYSLAQKQALVGPWVIGDLRNIFLSTDPGTQEKRTGLTQAFTTVSGNWRQATLNNRAVMVHDGAAVGDTPEGPPNAPERARAAADQSFLRQLYRNHFLPLTIAKQSHMQDGQIELVMNLLAGQHACTGGVSFGIRDAGSYFMLGLDAHSKRIALYEMIHGRRFKRLRKRYPVDTDRWYDMALRISGLSVQVRLNGAPVLAYTANRPPSGQVGMWARADTVVVFDRLAVLPGIRQEIAF